MGALSDCFPFPLSLHLSPIFILQLRMKEYIHRKEKGQLLVHTVQKHMNAALQEVSQTDADSGQRAVAAAQRGVADRLGAEAPMSVRACRAGVARSHARARSVCRGLTLFVCARATRAAISSFADRLVSPTPPTVSFASATA